MSTTFYGKLENIMTETKKKTREYVNNADFVKSLIDYKKRKELNPNEPIPNYIGECWMKIAEGLSHKPNFINYPHREEMIGDGIENCLMYFDNFNPDKSKNAFAYFTQIIYYAFLRRIQKEKKQLYVKYKATEMVGVLDEFELLEGEDGINKQFEMYDNISEFIATYEDSRANKKAAKDSKKKPEGVEKFME
jgi:hypothetical protein